MDKPIRIVVPFPAGGTSDVLARIVGQKLNAELVKIVNMPAVREKMAAQGAEPRTNSPEEFGA